MPDALLRIFHILSAIILMTLRSTTVIFFLQMGKWRHKKVKELAKDLRVEF